MTPRESEPQKETVERVMHEFKHGELRSGGSGQKLKSRRQAVAIALSEAGAVVRYGFVTPDCACSGGQG